MLKKVKSNPIVNKNDFIKNKENKIGYKRIQNLKKQNSKIIFFNWQDLNQKSL